jgi:hypothetical protein
MCGSKGTKFYSSLTYFQKCEEKSARIAQSNSERNVTWGDKISSSLRDKVKSQEHKDKISEGMKKVWSENPNMKDLCSRAGSKQSESTKAKIRGAVSNQKWYWSEKDGVVISTRSSEHPGEGWNLGRGPRR